MTRSAARRARAYAPAHVTGIFRPDLDARDPRGRGAIGAGLVLDRGVLAEATWTPLDRSFLEVTSGGRSAGPITDEVARRLRPTSPGRLTVQLHHSLPIGEGFGMSAAGALATALAVSALSGERVAKAVEVAHLAELFGAGGLGGVAAILGGGYERRIRPGIPPRGEIARAPFPLPMFVGVVGAPIPSPSILGSPVRMRRIAAASAELPSLFDDPSPVLFARASERFTDRVGLTTGPLRVAVRALRDLGAWAAQAMFGNSFFAVVPDPATRGRVVRYLSEHRVLATEVAVARQGARRLRTPGPFPPEPAWSQAF